VTVLTPVLAAALLSFTSLEAVIFFDLFTFAIAFVSLLCFIQIPRIGEKAEAAKETVLQSAKSGLQYLREHRGILDLILFLAIINFTASIFNAALPAMILSRTGGGEFSLGMVNMVTGIATMLGSLLVTVLPPPNSRARAICNALLFSMSTENFILAFGRNTVTWCVGAVLGWIFIPVMQANMDVLFRSKIPVEMQGRVYSARNTLQFFTIPLGYLCGGVLVDKTFEPFMAARPAGSVWISLFGSGKGAGAAMLFFVIGILGALSCLPFRADRHIRRLEE